ncbi:MAG TPA: portal protein [Bradyrhizobium sp.]|nr:portal protein [Bradyrhizobium sp.]
MFLARQPVSAPAPKRIEPWPAYYAHYTARLGALRVWRYSWWVHWARCAEFILPYRYRWLVTANTFNRGYPVNDRIIDETALLAMQVCGHGLLAGLMGGEWFKLGLGLAGEEPPDAAAREWLKTVQDRLYAVLDGSNFYTIMAQAMRDVATFGTAPVLINEDFEDVIRCYLPCAGEYYLAVGGRLAVDTFYREFTFTVAQIVDRFKLENCPEEVQQFWRTGGASLEREFVICHAIEPNFPIAGKGTRGNAVYLVPKGFTWRSVYWIRGEQNMAPLEARGEHDQPFAVAAWTRTSNDAYGRGPGMDALAATRQLQHEQERKGEFIDKGVRPPMGAHPQLEHKPASILPGELTFVNTSTGEKGFWPLFEVNPAHLAPMIEDIKEVQERINRCFYTDVFLMITQMEGIQPRNELELAERKGEKIQQLGPVILHFQTEFAPTVIHRVLGIMQRRRLFPPPPPSVRNKPLNIEFLSMMELAQRAAETASMERGFSVLGSLSEASKAAQQPDPIRTVNLDKAWNFYAERVGFPMTVMRSAREVAAIDKANAQAAQQAQAAQAGMAAVSAGQGLSNIQVGGGQNAVSALLGNGPVAGSA